jgi:hypothetical protein
MILDRNPRPSVNGSHGVQLHEERGGMALNRTDEITETWTRTVKRVIARYARGNISAQEGRILLPEEQETERRAAAPIARTWRDRYKKIAR